jgi:hemerythrin-like domain-containing protein
VRRSSDTRRAVSALFFYPRGDSAQVGRSLCRALLQVGWETTLVSGSEAPVRCREVDSEIAKRLEQAVGACVDREGVPCVTKTSQRAHGLRPRPVDHGLRHGQNARRPPRRRGDREHAHACPRPLAFATCPTLREWTANAERAFRYLAVCSDETVVGEDAVVSRTSELPEHGWDDAVPSSRRMKRHPALIPLSRDHHDGLVQAVRLRRAAADGDASARLVAAREFVEFFRDEERVHLRDEEEELFPLFLRHVQSQPAPLREARVHHVQLEGFARKLGIAVAAGIVDREALDAAGALLEAHIRLEERQLFPLIEELVPDDELRRLGLADRDATCAVRRPPLAS